CRPGVRDGDGLSSSSRSRCRLPRWLRPSGSAAGLSTSGRSGLSRPVSTGWPTDRDAATGACRPCRPWPRRTRCARDALGPRAESMGEGNTMGCFAHPRVPVVLEQKTTIFWKCLHLLASLKDSSGLGVTDETKRSSEEENLVHRQNTTVNVDIIRCFRPPYVWMKTFV